MKTGIKVNQVYTNPWSLLIQTLTISIGKHALSSVEFCIIIVLNILSAVQKSFVLMLCQ